MLCRPMQGGNERCEFGFLNVLKLINEHGEGGSGFLGRCAGCFQQSLQIMFEIAVVCQSWLGFKIKAKPLIPVSTGKTVDGQLCKLTYFGEQQRCGSKPTEKIA